MFTEEKRHAHHVILAWGGAEGDQLLGLDAAPTSRPQDPWHYRVPYEHFIWGKTSSSLERATHIKD